VAPTATASPVVRREIIDQDAAVGAALEVVATRERVDRSRVEMMRGYAETRQCRRQFLLAYFGETLPEPCGTVIAAATTLLAEPNVR
jgi:ATP-dependent DNA helicase RecQ